MVFLTVTSPTHDEIRNKGTSTFLETARVDHFQEVAHGSSPWRDSNSSQIRAISSPCHLVTSVRLIYVTHTVVLVLHIFVSLRMSLSIAFPQFWKTLHTFVCLSGAFDLAYSRDGCFRLRA